MQSRSRWDFFDMQMESANKGGGDEGFVLQKRRKRKKKKRSDCLDIVFEKGKYEIAPLPAFCQARSAAAFGVPANQNSFDSQNMVR